jgi:PAS domain S-box-containing protein
LTDGVDQAFFSADANLGRFIYVSPAFERVWGRPPDERLSGNFAWLEMIHRDDRERISSHIAEQVFRSDAERADREDEWIEDEFRTIDQNGKERWIRIRFRRIENECGPRIIGTQTDVTEAKRDDVALKERNEALVRSRDEAKRANAELARSNAELEWFAHAAAHDLREPLRNVVSFSELLERRLSASLATDDKALLAILRDAALRMDSLVSDLLIFSSAGEGEAGTMASLDEVMTIVLEAMKERIETKNAVVIREDRLPNVAVDAAEMQQVFSHLLSNALKYACPGTAPTIRIRSMPIDADFVRIDVEDDGIGIENGKKYEERIFGLFQRLHQRDEFEGGTGLGLALSKKIIERSGGRISAFSEGLGKGTTISFILPLVRRKHDA